MRRLVPAVLLTASLLTTSAAVAADPPADPAKVAAKAVAYLKANQEDAGSWSSTRSPGVTGVAVAGLIRGGGLTPDDPAVAKGLKYIEGLINAEEGHIAGKDPKVQLKNYVTSVNVMALQAAGRDDKYKKVVGDAVTFLKKLQWDEGEGKTAKDDFFGGAGYDSKSRPDLSNTQYFLDALKAAGVPGDDPAVKKAMTFVSRCQNLKGEWNDQPWADKIDDGSFIYTAAGGGDSKAGDTPTGGKIGYGSMTYAGVKAMIYAGLAKDDPRLVKSMKWLKDNYTVEGNPGMPAASANRGLYYYYHTMAKTFDALGVDTFEDKDGVKHDWRAEITAALAKRQQADGSWKNDADGWMEGDPNLVTSYALLTLGYCKKPAR